jgi:hypothetical protein
MKLNGKHLTGRPVNLRTREERCHTELRGRGSGKTNVDGDGRLQDYLIYIK